MNYNPRRLFVASCLALITSAFSFQMRQNVADDIGAHFQLTRELVGELMGGQFLGMALAMLIFSPLCDWIGMGKVLGLAWLCHAVGISGTIFGGDVAQMSFAPSIANALSSISGGIKDALRISPMPGAGANETSFWVLWLAAYLIGAGNGLVEVSLGSDDGLQAHQEALIYRGEKFIAKIEIVQTTPDKSVGKVIPSYKKGPIERDDRVVTKLP